MKTLCLLFFSLFSVSVPIIETMYYEEKEETFITKETPVFFDLQQLGISHNILNQNITEDEYEIIAMFLYEEYVFIYLWLGQWGIPSITHFDQIVLSAMPLNNDLLNIFEIGNSLNGLLNVVKYCDVLQVSVLSLNLTRDLLNYDNAWTFEIINLRFNDRNFICVGCEPFVVNFTFGVDYIDFEIENIRVLLSYYDVYRVNVGHNNNFLDGVIQFGGGTVDLFLFNFDFPVPLDNIHHAVFSFREDRHSRQRVVPFPWTSWNRINVEYHREIKIVPGVLYNPRLPNYNIEFFETAHNRQNQLRNYENSIEWERYDFSILISSSDFTETNVFLNRFQRRTTLHAINFIEMYFESNGRMYRSEIIHEEIERSQDVERIRPTATLPLSFVVIFWGVVAFSIPFIPYKLKFTILGIPVLSWFVHI